MEPNSSEENIEQNSNNSTEEEEYEENDIYKMPIHESLDEIFSKIPVDIMKTDEHPICFLVGKASDAFDDLDDALEDLTNILRDGVNKVDTFPLSNIDHTKIETIRAHEEGVNSI